MTDIPAPKFKRRNYYINRKFQTRFVVIFLLILIVSGCISAGLTLFSTQKTLTSTYDGSGLAIKKTSFAIMPSVILTTVITVAATGLVVLVVTLLISHKIAGPMFRFEQDLQGIANGDLQKKIQIRDGDQFGGVATNLNAMVESLHARVTIMQNELDLLVQKAAEQNIPQPFIHELEECKNKIDSQFRI
jgi:methyl-accepting chemotaxis protein